MDVLYFGTGLPRTSFGWRNSFVLIWGKIRRFYLIQFRPEYVRKSLARRRGECHRTGACCMLAFPCPTLSRLSKLPLCRIYARRPPNCHIFPIDERDLADRNLVNPWEPCGFSFVTGGKEDKEPPLHG